MEASQPSAPSLLHRALNVIVQRGCLRGLLPNVISSTRLAAASVRRLYHAALSIIPMLHGTKIPCLGSHSRRQVTRSLRMKPDLAMAKSMVLVPRGHRSRGLALRGFTLSSTLHICNASNALFLGVELASRCREPILAVISYDTIGRPKSSNTPNSLAGDI